MFIFCSGYFTLLSGASLRKAYLWDWISIWTGSPRATQNHRVPLDWPPVTVMPSWEWFSLTASLTIYPGFSETQTYKFCLFRYSPREELLFLIVSLSWHKTSPFCANGWFWYLGHKVAILFISALYPGLTHIEHYFNWFSLMHIHILTFSNV